jgi:Protein of unknown function (DUF3106)
MRLRAAQFVLSLALLPAAGVAAQPSPPQHPFEQANAAAHRQKQRQQQQQKQKQAGKNQPQSQARAEGEARGMAGLPPKWVEHLQELPPEEQERFLKNQNDFKSLPPERQAQVRDNLRHWNSLTPAERNNLRTEEHNWEQMSPDQREHIRSEILPRWQQLPPERRQLVMGRLRALRDMSETDREAKLNDEQFLSGLNPDERDLLRKMDTLRNPPPQ